MKDNGLTSINLNIGQVLRIRKPSEQIEVEECIGTPYVPPSTASYTIYTVKKGDNLYTIAKKYNTSTTAIMNLNGMANANLSIGQQLKIPKSSNNTSNTTYTVQKGDSLYSIAKKFNTTVDTIKNKNNLKSNSLSIGQKLII